MMMDIDQTPQDQSSSEVTKDEPDPIEQLRQRLGPLAPQQIAAWQKMTPVQRLEIAFQAYQFALEAVRLTERKRDPNLPKEEFNWRVTRRMQGNQRLGLEHND